MRMAHPLENHPVFERPADENVRIWRYIDLAKYLDLLETKQLYFARADLLGDPFEGSLPRQNSEWRTKQGEEVARKLISHGGRDPELRTWMRTKLLSDREWTFINCWHVNQHESAAMWRLYPAQAIAVRSTYARLRACLPGAPGKPPLVYVGLVRYLDYEADAFEEGNTYWPFIHKRKSFEHEKELRALHHDETGDLEVWNGTLRKGPPGVRVDVDLEHLIERIFVAPQSPAWLYELVRKVSDRYGLGKPVEQSALDAPAMF